MQQGEERINIGLDKSTNTNPDHLWYKFPNTPWLQSGIEGSLMIRPVLRAGKEVAVNVGEPSQIAQAPILFPNPGMSVCHWTLERITSVRIYDMNGRLVADLPRLAPGIHRWSTEISGIYLLLGTETDGGNWTQRWIAHP